MNSTIQITILNKIQAHSTVHGNMLLCSVENVDNMVQGFFETLLTHTYVNTDKQGHKANTKRFFLMTSWGKMRVT